MLTKLVHGIIKTSKWDKDGSAHLWATQSTRLTSKWRGSGISGEVVV